MCEWLWLWKLRSLSLALLPAEEGVVEGVDEEEEEEEEEAGGGAMCECECVLGTSFMRGAGFMLHSLSHSLTHSLTLMVALWTGLDWTTHARGVVPSQARWQKMREHCTVEIVST
jgi:hypothetical protein